MTKYLILAFLFTVNVATAANVSGDNFLVYNSMQCFDPANRSRKVTIQAPTLGASWALTLPVDGGTNGYGLSTNGSGVTSWHNFFTLPSLTSGSVLFSNGTTIAQDNAQFFWDDTNNSLLLNGGTASSGAPNLVLKSKSDSLGDQLQLESTSAASWLDFILRDSGDFFLFNPISGNIYGAWASTGFLSLGQVGGSRALNVTGFSSGTTLTTAQNANAIGIDDYDSTNNNFSPLYFSQSGLNDSAVIGQHDSHTGSSESGSLHFMTRSSGTFAERMALSPTGALKLDAYGAGCLQTDASGNVTANTCFSGTVTAVSVSSANGFAGSSSGGSAPALTLSTTVSGNVCGNGTALSACSVQGSGSTVLATSPTITTPTIAKLANLTSNGIVTTSGGDGTLSVTATSGSGNVVLATSPTIVTPTIAKLANLTTNGFVKTSGGDGTLGVQTSPIPAADINGGRTINAQTGTSYTFALSDASNAGGFPLVTGSNASAETFTVPPQSSVVWLAGAQIDVCQIGAGKLTIAQGAGVTINSLSSNKAIGGQYVCVTLVRTASDVWLLTGNLIP